MLSSATNRLSVKKQNSQFLLQSCIQTRLLRVQAGKETDTQLEETPTFPWRWTMTRNKWKTTFYNGKSKQSSEFIAWIECCQRIKTSGLFCKSTITGTFQKKVWTILTWCRVQNLSMTFRRVNVVLLIRSFPDRTLQWRSDRDRHRRVLSEKLLTRSTTLTLLKVIFKNKKVPKKKRVLKIEKMDIIINPKKNASASFAYHFILQIMSALLLYAFENMWKSNYGLIAERLLWNYTINILCCTELFLICERLNIICQNWII